MKILWVKTDFLHPTTRGGQIRTLEMLRRLHRRHEIHYVAFETPGEPEGVARASEYSACAWPIAHSIPSKRSLRFVGQLARGVVSPLPVAVGRYRSARMRRQIEGLLESSRFDSLVCDFLAPAPNIPELGRSVLFEHNVESVLWKRQAEQARGPRRVYFALQARRMLDYERAVCRAAGHVVAVSESDAAALESLAGAARVSTVPTGVDVEYFQAPANPAPLSDLVFVGSMDWMPNIDALQWFTTEILPLIRRRRPDCSLAIVGRNPDPAVVALTRGDPRIRLTGTVADVRPYLWGAGVAVVPLRVGSGTRLKIYEAMAAGTPVVSTRVGAEGLAVEDGVTVRLADTAADFARQTLALLDSHAERCRLAATARALVAARFSWDAVVRVFETILENGPRPSGAL